jgi:eukaryotic-like serine/threonine-protein kinase
MIGQLIQNYQVTAHLGEGGMGVVYKATDEVLGRDVALKMLHTPLVNQSQFLERFKKEARILAKLLHPNIAVIYNFIEQDNRHFMVMEYVEGSNLDQLLRNRNSLSFKAVVPVILQALEGLQHAHKKGICHRDIKPSNLILTPDGTVKLMDFGIAKIAGEQRLTQVARVIGTLEYMAPELIEGKDPSVATDIYALGVTMYELLTGRLPFSGSTDFNVMQDILKKNPLSPEKLNESIPKALCDIIIKALQKKPGERFEDAKDFQAALQKAFPALTSIDPRSVVSEVPATKLFDTAGSTQHHAVATVLQRLTLQQLSRQPFFAVIRQRFAAYKPAQLFVIGCLLTSFVVIALKVTIGRKPIISLTEKTQSATAVTQLPKVAARPASDQSNDMIVASNPVTINPAPVAGDINELSEVSGKPAESGRRKSIPANGREVGKKAPPTEKAVEPIPAAVKQTPQAVVAPEAEKPGKYIYVNGKLKVVLTLSGSIEPDDAREGQALRFAVFKPVTYEGHTIIEAGAAAEGRITLINKRKLVLVITSVEAVNGQKILFEQDEFGGKAEKVLSRKYYTGVIRKGLSLVL